MKACFSFSAVATYLFIDHSQIVQLEALRAGLWGTADVWGRIVTFKPS